MINWLGVYFDGGAWWNSCSRLISKCGHRIPFCQRAKINDAWKIDYIQSNEWMRMLNTFSGKYLTMALPSSSWPIKKIAIKLLSSLILFKSYYWIRRFGEKWCACRAHTKRTAPKLNALNSKCEESEKAASIQHVRGIK